MSRTTNRSSHSRQVAVTGAGTNGRPRQSLNPDQKSPSSSNSNDKKVVGHYVLGKTIGEGTFGKVRLAVHLPTGEKVAVKILEKSRIKEQADLRRVNREIKILKKAKHDNIIQLYEVLDTTNSIYLIMECAEAGEMFDYIVKHKHVEERQACNFFHQIVDGVEVLHQNFITHRDLKPENLLLKDCGSGFLLKIVDFGLSNTHEGGKLLSTACGSPCYAAPEMIAGKQYEGPLVDIWSMGVILFALVCGYLPFEDANTSYLYRKILSGEYKCAKWISSEVRDLIRKILETDPRKRFRLTDIRKNAWYLQVSDSDIPREGITSADNEIIKKETIKAVVESGLDANLVLDNIATKACNSLTATYHLFQQRFRNRRIIDKKNEELQKNALSVSSSAISGVNNSKSGANINRADSMAPSRQNLKAQEPIKPTEPSTERPSRITSTSRHQLASKSKMALSTSGKDNEIRNAQSSNPETSSNETVVSSITQKIKDVVDITPEISTVTPAAPVAAISPTAPAVGTSSGQFDRRLINSIRQSNQTVQQKLGSHALPSLSILKQQQLQYHHFSTEPKQDLFKILDIREPPNKLTSIVNKSTEDHIQAADTSELRSLPAVVDAVAAKDIPSDGQKINANDKSSNNIPNDPNVKALGDTDGVVDARIESIGGHVAQSIYSSLRESKPVTVPASVNTLVPPDTAKLLVSVKPNRIQQSNGKSSATSSGNVSLEDNITPKASDGRVASMVDAVNATESDSRPTTRRSRQRTPSKPTDLETTTQISIAAVDDIDQPQPGIGDIPLEIIDDHQAAVSPKIPTEPAQKPSAINTARRGRVVMTPATEALKELSTRNLSDKLNVKDDDVRSADELTSPPSDQITSVTNSSSKDDKYFSEDKSESLFSGSQSIVSSPTFSDIGQMIRTKF